MLALAGGCGSSGSHTASQSSSGEPAASSPTQTQNGDTSSTGSRLKATTTPEFATPSSSEPVRTGVIAISYRYYTIQPDTVRARVGSTIRWTNLDPTDANVRSVGGSSHIASKELAEGESFELKLTTPGTIHYVSSDHPTTMNGTIEVLR